MKVAKVRVYVVRIGGRHPVLAHALADTGPPRTMRRPAGPARRWTAVAAVLILAHAGWQGWQIAASPYPARYDYDEGVYAATAAAAAGGAHLYRDVFLAQPPLLVAALAGAYRAFGRSLAVARGTVVPFSILWLLSVFAIPAGAGRARAGALAACALAGSPVFLIGAHTVQMEVPSEGLAAAAVALALTGARREGILWWLAAGVAGGLAVMTKLTAAACAAPLLAAALLCSPGGRARRLAALSGGAVLATAPVLAALSGPGALSQVVAFHLSLARRMGGGPGAHLSAVGAFLAAEWLLVAAAAVGARPAAEHGDRLVQLSLVWLAAEGAVVMTLTPLWPHHLAVLLSPLALLAGIGADRLACPARPSRGAALAPPAGPPGASAARSGAAALGAAAVLAYLASGAVAAGAPGSSPDLRQAVAEVARALPADTAVLTDDPMVPFLARRPVPPELIDTSVARLRAGDLSLPVLRAALHDPRVGAVLLWRGTLKGEVPGVAAAAAARFPIRVDLGQGRVLLRRTGPGDGGRRRGPHASAPGGSG